MRYIIALLSLTVCSPAFAQEHEGHEKYHKGAYDHWMIPNTSVRTSCCQAREWGDEGKITGDCYPTEFRLAPTGWEALLDPKANGGKRVFISLPDNRMLHEKNPDPSGVSGHLCEINGIVLCWVPPTGTF